MSEVYLNIPENGNLDIRVPYVKIIEQDNIKNVERSSRKGKATTFFVYSEDKIQE